MMQLSLEAKESTIPTYGNGIFDVKDFDVKDFVVVACGARAPTDDQTSKIKSEMITKPPAAAAKSSIMSAHSFFGKDDGNRLHPRRSLVPTEQSHRKSAPLDFISLNQQALGHLPVFGKLIQTVATSFARRGSASSSASSLQSSNTTFAKRLLGSSILRNV